LTAALGIAIGIENGDIYIVCIYVGISAIERKGDHQACCVNR